MCVSHVFESVCHASARHGSSIMSYLPHKVAKRNRTFYPRTAYLGHAYEARFVEQNQAQEHTEARPTPSFQEIQNCGKRCHNSFRETPHASTRRDSILT